jgi:hypothetical protein
VIDLAGDRATDRDAPHGEQQRDTLHGQSLHLEADRHLTAANFGAQQRRATARRGWGTMVLSSRRRRNSPRRI